MSYDGRPLIKKEKKTNEPLLLLQESASPGEHVLLSFPCPRLKVEDYFPLQKRWWLRLKEKGGKVNEMGCHHKLEQYLDEYIAAAGIVQDKKGPLFRAAIGRTGKLSERSMSRVDAWYMVRRRARDAGIETAIGNHSFRAIGITDYLERGGDINIAKRMAGHSNVKTTELYDPRGYEVSFSEIERVGI